MLYPIGIQNFRALRERGFVYVDKTALMFKLVSSGKYYFLSRPRRFGKSLLVSTLESYFKGERELFSGLAIENMEDKWKKYPVLHLDFSGVTYKSIVDLNEKLSSFLDVWEREYGVVEKYSVHSVRLGAIIEAAYAKTGKPAVILIDEYDKPIIDNIGNEKLYAEFRDTLQGLYGVLKAKDGKILFGFITGVSKIGKLSVFSSLNNLNDISLNADYSRICGITEEELHAYFDASVVELAGANSISEEECFLKLKKMYDGYHFCENTAGIYNPFSLLSAFNAKSFKEYWFETGTPVHLVNVIKKTSFDITTLSDNVIVSASALGGMQDIVNKPVPLFYQTGYLTIKSYDKEYDEYKLGFPNDEVKKGFLNFIYSYYVPVNPAEDSTKISSMSRALKDGKPEVFMQILQALFADATYQIQGNAEKDFQYAMYIILELLGGYVKVEAERATSNGRMDLCIQTEKYIYIIEIKTDECAEAALRQIEEKRYDLTFADDSRILYKIGVDFSTTNRRIEDWKVIG